MAKCEITGKKPTVKNLVSHSNIKTKKWVKPNISKQRVYSDALKQFMTFNVAHTTARSIDHVGSFDRFILRQDAESMSKRARSIQLKIRKATGSK